MDIESIPRMVEEIESLLMEHGSISFIIKESNKYKFYKAIKRTNKMDALMKKYRTRIGKLLVTPYLMFFSAYHTFMSRSDRGLRNALISYRVAWRHISSIDGTSLPNKQCRISYTART